MTSGKRTILFTFLLLPLTATMVFAILQIHLYEHAHLLLYLCFYFFVAIISLCIVLYLIRDFRINMREKADRAGGYEDRFKALIENSYDAILLIDSSLKTIYRSPSAVRITGWSNDDDLTSAPGKFIYPDDAVMVGEIFSKTMENPGIPFPVLFRCLHKKGHFIWLEGSLTNMLASEPVKAFVFNARDATQRIESERQLEKTNREFSDYKFALDASSIVAITDQKGIITQVNENFCRISKYDSAELIGRNHKIISSGFHSKYFISNLWNTIQGGNIWRGELKNKAKDGSMYWVDTTIVPFLDSDQKPYQYIAIRSDITERKNAENVLKIAEEKVVESEKLYKSLFENLLQGYAYCKGIFEEEELVDFIYLAVNTKYESMTGFSDLRGKKVSVVNPDLIGSDQEYTKILGRVCLTGKPERFETYVERLDKWFSTSIYCPAVGYFVGLMDDISDQKKAERKNNLLNIELERKVTLRTQELKTKNEEIEAFSYSVSHDLRAPLRSIIGFTSILEEDYSSKLDAEARRLTGVIRKSAQKMGYLIDDLLAFSKLGRQEINKTQIETGKMVEQVILELENKSSRSQISWVIHPLASSFGDINSIHQVWVNFLSNAMKYSAGRSSPKIEISSYTEGHEVVFRIDDNGVGFDPKYTAKLFKVFQRLHAMNEFEGTGVGLAIVERIISRHGGRVWATGEVGKGASFYFSMPEKNKGMGKQIIKNNHNGS
jgi:PAS domain S-box-containing protein